MATATFEPYDKVVETQTRNVFRTLSEKDRRRFAAIQARQLGHGGIASISKLLAISESTISRGIDELDTLPDDPAEGRVRRPGAGRKKSDAGVGCRSEPSVADRIANGRRPR